MHIYKLRNNYTKAMKKNKELTPQEIVEELDRFIIGQDKAKHLIAVALRNRWRRLQVKGKIREEILPSNILMIGPTGVGKTEIARRIARLTSAPFVKVEATKYSEVGYVGRDVESIIRELMDISVDLVKNEHTTTLIGKAKELVQERVLDILLPESKDKIFDPIEGEKWRNLRENYRRRLIKGEFDDHFIEIEINSVFSPTVGLFTPAGFEEMGVNFQQMFDGILPKKKKARRVKVSEAKQILESEEMAKLIDMDKVVEEAKVRLENSGIVFLDEIDKIVGSGNVGGPDVSREGVQRDLLPIIEGCSVVTKYGIVRTDHILFIAAGAFKSTSPSELIPELQGRLPLRVEFTSLGAEEFRLILTEPENSLLKQYKALLATEGTNLSFTKEAVAEIANIAHEVNIKTEDIGARRLQTILATLLEDYLFEVPPKHKKIRITKAFVTKRFKNIVADVDVARYVL